MLSTRLILLAVVACGVVSATPAAAANLRAQRTVAGARATLGQYDTDIIAGYSKSACALLTTKAQTQLARENHATSCAAAIEVASAALKAAPAQTAALRSYARKARVTLHGDTATVPKLGTSGHVTLTYTHGLWYLS
jgi:hypothetical protein